MDPVLWADSIGKSYGTERILTSATIKAMPGSTVGVLGRMGAGKSTLLKICGGLLSPDSGWVRIRDRLYTKRSPAMFAREGLFFVQERNNLVPWLTLRQHFDSVKKVLALGEFDSAAQLMMVAELLDEKVRVLSGGELRRAEIAIAIYRRPKCLLLDEAFLGLDPLTVDVVLASLDVLKNENVAIIITGHEVESIVRCADEIVWVTSGTTYALGAPPQAWENEEFRRTYLGTTGTTLGAV